MNTLQHLLYDGSPFARPCDGQRNIATAPVPVVPGSDAALSLRFMDARTFRPVPATEIASGVAAWRFCVADGLDRAKPMLYATDAVMLDISADTLDIDIAGAWTEQMRDAIGDRPKAVFMAELAGYASAEDAGTATSPIVAVSFPFCAANRRDDGAETTPLRDLSIEAHNASPTAHPAIRDALAHKADLVNGKVPKSQLPSYDAPVPSTAAPQMDGAASPGSSSAYARGDHRHPVDTSRASVADATLNGRGVNGSGFSEWTITAQNELLHDLRVDYESTGWTLYGVLWTPVGATKGVQDDTHISWTAGVDSGVDIEAIRDTPSDSWDVRPSGLSLLWGSSGAGWTPCGVGHSDVVGGSKGVADSLVLDWDSDSVRGGGAVHAVRSALPGYVLGNQTEKPLADADATAAAIAAKYGKPSGGIPKSDLARGVQESLEKADAALPKGGGTLPIGGMLIDCDSEDVVLDKGGRLIVKDTNVSDDDSVRISPSGVVFAFNDGDAREILLGVGEGCDIVVPDETGTLALTSDIPVPVYDGRNHDFISASDAESPIAGFEALGTHYWTCWRRALVYLRIANNTSNAATVTVGVNGTENARAVTKMSQFKNQSAVVPLFLGAGDTLALLVEVHPVSYVLLSAFYFGGDD